MLDELPGRLPTQLGIGRSSGPGWLFRSRIGRAGSTLFVLAVGGVACDGEAPEPSTERAEAGAVEVISPGALRAKQATERLLAAGEAGRIILRSAEAHGGLETWYEGGAISFRWDFRPLGPPIPPVDSLSTVELLSARAYQDMYKPAQGVIAWDGVTAWGKFEESIEFPIHFWTLSPYYFLAMPFVFSDPGVNLEVVDDDAREVGLAPSDAVRVTYDVGTGSSPDDWYIVYVSKENSRLLAARHIVTWKPLFSRLDPPYFPERINVYEDFEAVGPLTLARKNTFYMMDRGARGEKVADVIVSEITFPSEFDAGRLVQVDGATVDRSMEPFQDR